METEKLYYNDSYISEFDANVLSCTQADSYFDVVLDKTAFFPEEGGQYCDSGTLGGYDVFGVREIDGVIKHRLKSPLTVGSTVHGIIDFDERFEKMQCHSGEHIVSGIISEKLGLNNVGFHLGRDDVTIDFNGHISSEQLSEIETAANEAVYKNIEIICYFPCEKELSKIEYRSKNEIAGKIRIVTVPGYDICACCAPHVKHTGEIGIIKFISKINYKGGVRIHMLCGARALRDYAQRCKIMNEISNITSVKEKELAYGVKRILYETAQLKVSISDIKKKVLREKISLLAPTSGNTVIFEDILDGGFIRDYINAAMEKTDGICAVISEKSDGSFSVTAGSKNFDMTAFAEVLKEKFQARAGGSTQMISGTLKGNRNELIAFINNFTKADIDSLHLL